MSGKDTHSRNKGVIVTWRTANIVIAFVYMLIAFLQFFHYLLFTSRVKLDIKWHTLLKSYDQKYIWSGDTSVRVNWGFNYASICRCVSPPRLYTYTPCYSLYPALLFIASAKMEIGHHESAVSLRNAHWGMKDPLCLVT